MTDRRSVRRFYGVTMLLVACNPFRAVDDEQVAREANVKRLRATLSCDGCDLKGVSLADAKLAGANLAGARLDSADLSRADLRGANLSLSILAGVRAPSADLSQAKVDGAVVEGADFTGAKLVDVDFHDSARCDNLQSCNFANADLRHANMSGCGFYGGQGIFRRVPVSVVTYYGTDTYMEGGAIFRGANLENANFSRAILKGADLGAANLSSANLEFAQLEHAELAGTSFTGAHLGNASFDEGRCPEHTVGMCTFGPKHDGGREP